MKRFLVIAAAAAAVATVAQAGMLKGDPRKCGYDNPRYCAQAATTATVRGYMARREHVRRWDWLLTCQPTYSNLLRWKCTYLENGQKGVVTVRYRATSRGWRRIVRVA